MSEDTLEDFIGANLITVKVTDTALETWEEIKDVYEGRVMFVNLETTMGLLQLVAYNDHYGHNACFISKQINKQVVL